MIVEDEKDTHYKIVPDEFQFEYEDLEGNVIQSLEFEMSVTSNPEAPGLFATVLERFASINSSQHHRQLRDDLKNHLFQNFPLYTKKLQR